MQHSDLGWVLLYAFRRRLEEALRRRTTLEAGDQPTLAMGFVDLVDFTPTSASMQTDELGRLLGRFEALASDVITEAGGRVVKLIGDEAMLVFPTADQAAQGAIELVDACAAGDLPSARAGLSLGQVLARGGDYFGRPVNLASRLVDVAPPDTVLADDAFVEAISATMTLVIEPQTPKRLKGLGSVHVRASVQLAASRAATTQAGRPGSCANRWSSAVDAPCANGPGMSKPYAARHWSPCVRPLTSLNATSAVSGVGAALHGHSTTPPTISTSTPVSPSTGGSRSSRRRSTRWIVSFSCGPLFGITCQMTAVSSSFSCGGEASATSGSAAPGGGAPASAAAFSAAARSMSMVSTSRSNPSVASAANSDARVGKWRSGAPWGHAGAAGDGAEG